MRVDCHEKVLGYLAEQWSSDGICFSDFGMICAGTGLDRKQVRRSCRCLARKDLAIFGSGLWTEDASLAAAAMRLRKPVATSQQSTHILRAEHGQSDTGNKKPPMSQRLS